MKWHMEKFPKRKKYRSMIEKIKTFDIYESEVKLETTRGHLSLRSIIFYHHYHQCRLVPNPNKTILIVLSCDRPIVEIDRRIYQPLRWSLVDRDLLHSTWNYYRHKIVLSVTIYFNFDRYEKKLSLSRLETRVRSEQKF